VSAGRISAAALVAAIVTALALPADAAAHAVLERTVPERGDQVDRAPAAIELYFNEPVEASFGAVRVFDATGSEVHEGEPMRPGSRSDAIGVALPAGLPDGTYTATYRVISADSHPVSGGFIFSVGRGGPASSASVSDLLGDEAGPTTDIAFGIARGATYAATALVVGGLLFAALAFAPALRRVGNGGLEWRAAADGFRRRMTLMLGAAVVAGLVAGAAGIVLQGASAAGVSFWDALDPDVIEPVLETRFGTVWAFRELAWLMIGAGLFALPGAPAGRLRAAILALATAFLLVASALSGHASVQDPVWLLAPTDVLHVAAMSTWVGGIAAFVWAVRGATAPLAPSDRTRLLAAVTLRFSPIALTAVLVLAATGTVQSIVHLEAFPDFLDTAFGRAVLIKIGLFCLLVGLGAVHRRRVIPRLRAISDAGEPPGGSGHLLRRVLTAEAALFVAVLGVTAALVSYAPPTALSEGPQSTVIESAGIRTDLTVDPATPGSNEVHVYLFDAATGTPAEDLRGVALSASLPAEDVGPLELELRRAGPGHFIAPDAALGIPGDWSLEVSGRLSRFEEMRGSAEVAIR
jgi:copper transport protein